MFSSTRSPVSSSPFEVESRRLERNSDSLSSSWNGLVFASICSTSREFVSSHLRIGLRVQLPLTLTFSLNGPSGVGGGTIGRNAAFHTFLHITHTTVVFYVMHSLMLRSCIYSVRKKMCHKERGKKSCRSDKCVGFRCCSASPSADQARSFWLWELKWTNCWVIFLQAGPARAQYDGLLSPRCRRQTEDGRGGKNKTT